MSDDAEMMAALFGVGGKQGCVTLRDGGQCTPKRLAEEWGAMDWSPPWPSAAAVRRYVDRAIAEPDSTERAMLMQDTALRFGAGFDHNEIQPAAIGIDPGLSGAIVAVDGAGAHLWTIPLGPLWRDETVDGPSGRLAEAERVAFNEAVDAERARRKAAGERLKGVPRKKEKPKAKKRFNPPALGWIARTLASIGCPIVIEGLLYMNVDNIGSAERRGQSRQSSATTDENHGRIVGAFGGAGADVLIVPPQTWQAGWSCQDTYPQFPTKDGRKSTRWHLEELPDGRYMPRRDDDRGPLTAPKVRSIAAACGAGFRTRDDAPADAFGIARWNLRQGA